MNIKYEINGITLDAAQLCVLHNYYREACTAEVIMEQYNVEDEKFAMQLAQEVREMQEEDSSEAECIFVIAERYDLKKIDHNKSSDELTKYDGWEVKLVTDTYQTTNNLYVGLVGKSEEEPWWQPYADITVNLDETCEKDCSYININNLGDSIIEWLIENNLGELTINYSMSGYCVYPEFHFNINEVNKHLYKKEEPTKTAIEQYADKQKAGKTSSTEQER